MSWDPNQPQQGQPPSGPSPYGQPPSGPNPYDPRYTPQPQNPYAQSANGQPQSPYEQPSNGQPFQNPYGQPASMPNPPYTPQPQNPYAQPFGAPVAVATAYGYAAQGPLPLGQAIQGLPNQYMKILTRPSVQSFAEEQGKATWGIIWLQLLFLGLLSTIIALIIGVATASLNPFATSASGIGSTTLVLSLVAGGSIVSLITIPLFFFIGVGIQYLLAKAFGGNGLFKQQAYNHLLFMVPATVVGSLLGWIPFLGGLVSFAVYVYEVVLNVFSIQAVHRLSGGKAILVVLIPIIVGTIVVILIAVLLIAALVALFHGATASPTYP